MSLKNKYNYYFYPILGFIVFLLISFSNTLSISYKEAVNYFLNNSILSYLIRSSTYIFGQNDIALRLPFIVFYFLSILLLYKMTNNYFKNDKDRFYSILIFMILPGVLGSSLLVNSSIMVLFFTLLYLYIYENYKKHSYLLLVVCLFIDNSFAILYLALFFYSLKTTNKKLLFIAISLFCVSMYIYGFSTEGKPKGYFLDTFAIYASIFSPFLFIYFLYTIYRTGLKNEKTLTWYISTTALLFSLLFSFRQRIYIEDFAPYVVISLPFMLKSFFHSYRVRLKEFRIGHNFMLIIVIGMLIINVLITFFNKPIYLLLTNPSKHFVYKYHFAKDIANELKKKNINYINSEDKKLLLRLKYYGIEKGNKYYISKTSISNFTDIIIIKYNEKELYKVFISER